MDGESKVLMVLLLITCVALFGLVWEDYVMNDTDKESVREKSELEQELDADENLVDISSVCSVKYGVDEEYGAYYEIRMYDESTVRYYKADGTYEIRENSNYGTIVETMDYWIILYEEGQSVKYKKKSYEDMQDNVIGVIEE